MSHRLALLLVVALIALHLLLFTALAIAQHEAHRTSVFDLGVYDQVIWNTAHGRILAYSPEPEYGDNFLATHLQPILILLAPLYWLWDDVRALFVVQTAALALGALPLFWLARWKTRSDFAAVTLSAAYLLLPALEAANLFDFHPETFAPVLCLSIFLLLEQMLLHSGADQADQAPGPRWLTHQRSSILFWLLLILALAVKEDMALIVATLGLYVTVLRRQRRLGLAIVALAMLWFFIGVYLVMPHFHRGQLSPFLSYYAALGDSPQTIVWNALTRPDLTVSLLLTRDNAAALGAFFLPLAFLPLLDLSLFLIATPSLLLNSLSENPLMHVMEDKHYAATIIPFAMLAATYGIARLRAFAPKAGLKSESLVCLATLALLMSTLGYHYVRGYTPLSRLFQMPTVTSHDQLAASLQAQIPREAALVAQDRPYPHLSHRAQMAYLWPEHDEAEYIFLDIAHASFVNADDLHAWLKQQVAARAARRTCARVFFVRASPESADRSPTARAVRRRTRIARLQLQRAARSGTEARIVLARAQRFHARPPAQSLFARRGRKDHRRDALPAADARLVSDQPVAARSGHSRSGEYVDVVNG